MIKYMRWETETRYYETRVMHDLFGTTVLLRCWGSRGTANGSSMTTPFSSIDEALRAVRNIAHVRKRHGYQLTYGIAET